MFAPVQVFRETQDKYSLAYRPIQHRKTSGEGERQQLSECAKWLVIGGFVHNSGPWPGDSQFTSLRGQSFEFWKLERPVCWILPLAAS